MHVKFQEDQKLIAISSNNVKISNFYDLILCIKNKFIDWIVNNIRFEQNLIYMLRTQKHEIQRLDFQNSHPKKKYMRNLKSFSLK